MNIEYLVARPKVAKLLYTVADIAWSYKAFHRHYLLPIYTFSTFTTARMADEITEAGSENLVSLCIFLF